MVAERAGAAIGAIVATFPVAAGPAYVFVALDHDSAFIAASAIGSIAAHAATAVFSLVYIVLAQRQRHGRAASAAPSRSGSSSPSCCAPVQWTFLSVAAANLAIFGICIALTNRYRHVQMPMIVRKWYDIPVRAFMVACLVAAVVGERPCRADHHRVARGLSDRDDEPLMLIFQARVGGPASAALIANTMWGLVGFSACLFTVHLAVVPLGTWAGLRAVAGRLGGVYIGSAAARCGAAGGLRRGV